MRLKSIAIEGFRGFVQKVEIDLGADVVLLQGPNGAGKTSLLDAILWALTGRLDRFHDKGSPISLYSREGIARVALTLCEGERDFVVTRVTDSERDGVKFCSDETEFDGSVAQSKLAQFLLPHLPEHANSTTALSNVLTRGVYLQQDLVRQFIDSDSDADRFSLISQIIGAGMILELQAVLEKARNQWSRNMTSQRKELLDPLLEQASRIDSQIRQFNADPLSGTGEASADSTRLFDNAIELIGREGISLSEAPTSSSSLDRLLKEVGAERVKIERELSTIKATIEESKALASETSPDSADMQLLQDRETKLLTLISGADARVNDELGAIARLREQRLQDQNRINRLATMAKLALDDLEGKCPVCQQDHDVQKTTKHLHDLIGAASESPPDTSREENVLLELSHQRDRLRQDLMGVRTLIQERLRAIQEFNARRSVWLSRLAQVGIVETTDVIGTLTARVASLSERLHRVTSLLRDGENLSVRIVRVGEQRRRAELQQQRSTLSPKIIQLQREIERLEKTHALAGRIIDGLRRASLEVTSRQIDKVAPLFQRIYSRIDPHPTFRVTELVT